ncbi:MAG: protein kinase [Planctomycetota bacterium]
MDPTPEPRAERNLVDVLAALSRGETRYDQEGEIARGGMGSIHRVWDRDLRRPLAMKVFLGDVEAARAASRDSSVDARVARFVEEAQITGQLDHPGIVPVHEIGLDETGQLFFTMRLVQGHTLGEVFELAREGKDGWSSTRVLRTLVRVCEAVAYAHSRGVVHRDLKPANIMVGQFGEVYVMDWGLAKLVDGEERPTERSEEAPKAPRVPMPSIRSDRVEQASATPESYLLTVEGNVLGTPSYMPPEQALGRLQDLGPRSDVYALGAILYEFLSGQAPYAPEGAEVTAHRILESLLEGPPRPLSELCPDAPPELRGICERAMAREAEDRYADSLGLAEALSAFFERPVNQARSGLQRSRLVTGLRWLLGLAFWFLAVVLVGVCILVPLAGDSPLSVSLPIAFDIEEPSFELGSDHPWVEETTIVETRGNLLMLSRHPGARLAIVGVVAVTVLFLMYFIQQVRRILRNVRRGEPFAPDNMRCMRRMGIALLAVGLLRMIGGPLMGAFAEGYLEISGLRVRSSYELSMMEFVGGAMILILAEVFRVGAELERREE